MRISGCPYNEGVTMRISGCHYNEGVTMRISGVNIMRVSSRGYPHEGITMRCSHQ